ncbi:polysaccharide biosynthesis tyrosine autokinase [Photobacterium damselae subsp. damselae]|uniref:non-specific protein-tyrosine kinase n=1 Tax=Photobacterium damselae subsp. damselae TaxID=85581 RepID=A0A850QUE6_PHODD|nr:polysaccharide biosynthesis tyrosine autokinase [Photobacterium damselae subsp. damselae]
MSSLFVENGSKLESTIDFSRLLKSTKKNWWKIVLFTAAMTGASIPLIMNISPKYESYATVLLKAELTNPTTFTKVTDFDSTRKEYYETQYQLMKSHRVLDQVVNNLQLYKLAEFVGNDSIEDDTLEKQKARSLQYLAKYLSIAPIRKTQLVSVGFESLNPKLSADVANEVVDVFTKYSINDNHEASSSAAVLLSEQVSDLDNQLKAKEAKLNEFLKQEGLITFRGVDGFQTEQLSLLSDNLATATAQRVNIEALYHTVMDNKKRGLSGLVGIPDISRHPQMETLRQMIIEQKSLLSDLEDRYGPKYVKVIQARSQLNTLQNQANKVVGEITAGIKEQYQAAVIRENKLQSEVNKQANAFQLLGEKKTRYDNMMDDINQTRTLYNQLLKRQNETQVSSQFSEPSAKLIDPAIVPTKPSKPNKKLLIVLVAIMSFLLSTIFILVMAALNNKVMTLSEIKRRLGLEALGEIRCYNDQFLPNGILENSNNFKTLDEASFGIRSKLLLNNSTDRVFGITSATSHEGKSVVATLIAKALMVDLKVLLIDMDLRSSTLTKSLGYTDDKGLIDVLYGRESINTVIKKRANIDILTVGSDLSRSPLVTLTDKRLTSIIDEVKLQYDYVIIDTPSTLNSQDAVLIGQYVDKMIFVTQSNFNSANVCVSAINELINNNILMAGCVLNKVKENQLESNENINDNKIKDIIL